MNVQCPPVIVMPLWAQLCGYVAAVLTILFPIPQVWSIWNAKTPVLSVTTWYFTALRGVMWVPFGIGFAIRGKTDDALTMISSNMIAACICFSIILRLKYNTKTLYSSQKPEGDTSVV